MPDPPPPYTLTDPDDLLGLVPYVIGFHPDNDLVVLFEQRDRRIRHGHGSVSTTLQRAISLTTS